MKEDNFELRIVEQLWYDEKTDLCSHGKIYLKVNDTALLTEEDGEWTTFDSALALLRTVKFDFPSDKVFEFYYRKYGDVNSFPESPQLICDADSLIYHCGSFSIFCPARLRWDVRHEEGLVTLDNFRKYPSTDEKDVIEYPGLTCKIPLQKYARTIYGFASEVRNFYDSGIEKDLELYEIWAGQYSDLWDEFNELLQYTEKLIVNQSYIIEGRSPIG